jgi:hypothetical protein
MASQRQHGFNPNEASSAGAAPTKLQALALAAGEKENVVNFHLQP